MQTKENVTIYKCDFCNKFLQRKHAMEEHEKKCIKNPENMNFCEECRHLERFDSYYTIESHGCFGNSERAVKCNAFKCLELKKNLFPRKVLFKGILERFPETFEESEPMPNCIDKCEHFERFDFGTFDIFENN